MGLGRVVRMGWGGADAEKVRGGGFGEEASGCGGAVGRSRWVGGAEGGCGGAVGRSRWVRGWGGGVRRGSGEE